MPRRELDQDEIRVLSTLSALLGARKGWKRGGVRGWALGTELNTLTKSSTANLYLAGLRAAGLVFGDQVHDPGRPARPLSLWRITKAGEDAVAALEGRPPRRVRRPKRATDDERTIFISRSSWECLRALQGRNDWVLFVQLSDDVQALWEKFPHSDDLRPILIHEFALREEREGPRGQRIFYRVTELGRAVRLLDQKTSEELVQLLVSESADR